MRLTMLNVMINSWYGCASVWFLDELERKRAVIFHSGAEPTIRDGQSETGIHNAPPTGSDLESRNKTCKTHKWQHQSEYNVKPNTHHCFTPLLYSLARARSKGRFLKAVLYIPASYNVPVHMEIINAVD